MGKATNAVTAERVRAFKKLLLSGGSCSTCVEHAATEWGLGHRQARRLVKRAWNEIQDDVGEIGVERREMLAWCIHQLQAAAGEGIKHKQPSVTVGACRELNLLLGLGAHASCTHRR